MDLSPITELTCGLWIYYYAELLVIGAENNTISAYTLSSNAKELW